MTDKKYLKWYHKIGYGSGDVAGNVVYAFLTAFVMFYLTDSMGMSMGIVGTLMAISKLFDGVSDFFFGSLIDKTKSKMGKARPWMLWAYIGNSVLLVATFSVPSSWGETAQYAYFFITYTLLNAVFFTANNIAYAALTALITKNAHERVQLGSIRFIFAFSTSMAIQALTTSAVDWLGGGAQGWRAVAIIYAIIGLAVNTLSVFSVKELSDEGDADDTDDREEWEKKPTVGFFESVRLLVSNKYYLLICAIYIMSQISAAMLAMGVYYMKYILGNEDLLGAFSLAVNIPLIIGLLVVPTVVKKLGGMYRLNLVSYGIATLGRGLVILAAYMGSVPLMLAFTALASFGTCPLQGDLNALIAACAEHTALKSGKSIEGMMFSCSSLGIKIGGGIGTAISGWLLDAAGYIENAAVQPDTCVAMLNALYLFVPMVLCGVITLLLSGLRVEQANKKLLEDTK